MLVFLIQTIERLIFQASPELQTRQGRQTMDDAKQVRGLTGGWNADVEIPRIVRPWPTNDTFNGARLLLGNIDNRIAWLAERELRAHPTVLQRRAELLEQIARLETAS